VEKRGIQVIGRSHTAQVTNTSSTNIVLFTKWHRLHEACHDRAVAYLHQSLDAPSQPAHYAKFSPLPPLSTMDANPQRPKGRDGALSSLNLAIEAVNLARDIVDIAPAKVVFGSVGFILTRIKVCFLLVRLVNPKLMYTGFHDQQNRLCRPRACLRRCM
jgi:hypothetical protein